ncbi:uncharacterized protein C8R40DRAFT_1071604 [Lentinula edodes]|uniref:uncharacterized protein n=1 Tax=Lentinula edodes TaxID=5353 RepID=UPI001E8D498E|nr:uncharacterized protein C8R40DRAFT_1071604 [Lentinula edodes]KAH7872680.1 hypothetical protein C8R40DRAFT_1071604 [Lentinula edodes]
MNSQQSGTDVDHDHPYGLNLTNDGFHSHLGIDAGKKLIWKLPYFPPLSSDDEFEIHDLELVQDNEKKRMDILVRPRMHSLARPTYKIEKQTHSHFLGKKTFDILISRLDSWDSIHCRPIQSQSSKVGKVYIVLFQAKDQSPRHISLTPTKSMVLHRTARGGDICLTPHCGSYDPQRSRAPQPRLSSGYHYLPLHITNFEHPPSMPVSKSIPAALTKPYSGGGYLLFDAHSRGRSDLLSTLYCTGYERRCVPRTGDVVLAELRLSRPATDDEVNSPSWSRLFRERHVSLFISKRGIDAVFTGLHVNMFVPNSVESNRYSLTFGHAQEIIISLFATSLLAIEHEGIESKKWAWLLKRRMLESDSELASSRDTMHSSTRGPEHAPIPSTLNRVCEREFQDTDSISFTDVDHRHRAKTPDFDKWKVVTYQTPIGEAVSRDPYINDGHYAEPTDLLPARNTEFQEVRRTKNGSLRHGTKTVGSHYPGQQSSSNVPETPHSRTLKRTEPMEVLVASTDVIQPPEPPRIWPKEGPKVTGKPKPGVEGGIYW